MLQFFVALFFCKYEEVSQMANSSIKLTNKNIYTIDIKDEEDNIIHTLKFHIND